MKDDRSKSSDSSVGHVGSNDLKCMPSPPIQTSQQSVRKDVIGSIILLLPTSANIDWSSNNWLYVFTPYNVLTIYRLLYLKLVLWVHKLFYLKKMWCSHHYSGHPRNELPPCVTIFLSSQGAFQKIKIKNITGHKIFFSCSFNKLFKRRY